MPWMLCLCETMVKAILLLLLLILLYAARPNDTFRRKEINFLHEHDIHFICPSFILATGINKKKDTHVYTHRNAFSLSFRFTHSFRVDPSFFFFFFFRLSSHFYEYFAKCEWRALVYRVLYFLYIHTPVNRISIWDCRYRKLTYN